MGDVTKFFAVVGLGAAIGLSAFDFVTSVMGIHQIMGKGNEGFIVGLMPFFFAALALCFNALSAHMFYMHKKRGFTSFASTVTFFMWVFFLGYDLVSGLVGVLASYSSMQINSLQTCRAAFASVGWLAGAFIVVMAALLSSGPFLCRLFSDLREHTRVAQ